MKPRLLLLIVIFSLASCAKEEQQTVENKRIVHVLPAELEDVDILLSADDLLFEIEGNYSVKDAAANCILFISLFRENGVLKYHLDNNGEEFSGDAKIDLVEEKDGYYIAFKNIEWSEYLGDIQTESDVSDIDWPLPQDLQGVIYRDEIFIQNYGNSMNDYVQLAECDDKYIHLTKQ